MRKTLSEKSCSINCWDSRRNKSRIHCCYGRYHLGFKLFPIRFGSRQQEKFWAGPRKSQADEEASGTDGY